MADKTMDSGHALSPDGMDMLGEVGNISMGAAATALSGLLNTKVEITVPMVEVMSLDEAKHRMGENHILVKVHYQSGLSGSNMLLIKEEDTRVMVGMMMGGDGKEGLPDFLGDMEMSALGEAMNQMMGSAATAMSDFFSRRVVVTPPEVIWEDVKAAEESWLEEQNDNFLVIINFRLAVDDVIDSSMFQMIPLTFSREMVENILALRETETKVMEEESIEQEISFQDHRPSTSSEVPKSAAGSESALDSLSIPPPEQSKVKAQPVEFAEFSPGERQDGFRGNLELIMDVSLPLVVELGQSRLSIREILDLGPGSIIELDKLAGEPADLYINDVLFARGEIVVIEENFGVRISEIVSTEERIRSLREV